MRQKTFENAKNHSRQPHPAAQGLNTTWRDRALLTLRGRPAWLGLETIARDTGLGLGWLKAFAQGRSSEPSVNRIETLLSYLDQIERDKPM
jgi:hypothetical protein